MGRFRRVRDEDLYEPADSLYEPLRDEDLYEPVDDPYEPVRDEDLYEAVEGIVGPAEVPSTREEARRLYSRMSRDELEVEVRRLVGLIQATRGERRRAEHLCISAPEWAKRELWSRIDELRRRERRLRLALKYAMMNYAAQCGCRCDECRLSELCGRMVWRH